VSTAIASHRAPPILKFLRDLQQLQNASKNERLEMTVDVGEVYAERKPTCEFGFLVRPILIGQPPNQADGGTSLAGPAREYRRSSPEQSRWFLLSG
jgi:hypothetical protein